MHSTSRVERLKPEYCALVVVDVQNDFFHERGSAAQMGLDMGPVQKIRFSSPFCG